MFKILRNLLYISYPEQWIWATMLGENVSSNVCPQRIKSACVSVQSDQSLLSAWRNVTPLAIGNVPREDSDQLVHLHGVPREIYPEKILIRMCKLAGHIWIFAGPHVEGMFSYIVSHMVFFYICQHTWRWMLFPKQLLLETNQVVGIHQLSHHLSNRRP